MTLKVLNLYAGIGGVSFALNKAEIDFECVGYSEVNKYAIQCYKQNFSNVKNYGDISKINIASKILKRMCRGKRW